jgi:hypothetical protein
MESGSVALAHVQRDIVSLEVLDHGPGRLRDGMTQ